MDAVLVTSKYAYRSTILNPVLLNIYSPIVRYNNKVSCEDVNNMIKTYPLYIKKDAQRIVRSMSWSN